MATIRPCAPAVALFGARSSVSPELLANACLMSAAERASVEAVALRVRAAYGMSFAATMN